MKTAFWIACIWVLGTHSTRPNLDDSDVYRVSASGYVLKYKGFRCIKNKSRNAGFDVKMYFLCIPEKMRPKEMAALTFDSLALYESVKSETVQNGPVFTLYDGADTMGITILCNMVEGKADDHTMNQLNEVLKDFKISYYGENPPPPSNLEVPSMDTTKGDIANANNASNPNRKSSSWVQKFTTVANLNPMSIVTWIFQPKAKEIGKKYLYISSNDLKCYSNTPPTKAFEIEHHFSMILQKGKSVYEVYFEIVPK
jgi:hypothetical protein